MRLLFRSFVRAISRRDALLVFLGAASIHILYSLLPPVHESSAIIFDTHISHDSLSNITPPVRDTWHAEAPPSPPSSPRPSSIADLDYEIPQTELVSHAPGWTIFRNLYMADGTLFIVTSKPESFPDIKLMTSTGLPALNTPESIAERMPTSRDMSVIDPEEARARWGGDHSTKELNRIFPIEGSTVRSLTLHPDSPLTRY
jgi:hypothetical protein